MERFLIAGCQRSGTTLMRLLLDSHSRIECHDEQSSYVVLSGKQAEVPRAGDFIGFKIPIWTEQLLEPTLDGNELALNSAEWQRTPNFYAGEKIIFLIRDPLDTIASMIQLKWRTGITWLKRYGLPVMERKMSDVRFVEEFSEDLKIIDSSGHDPVVSAALYWKFKSKSFLKYKAANLPAHPVLYEQLVTSPKLVLKGLTDFLGTTWEDALLNHHRLPHPEVENGTASGYTNASRSIDGSSVGRWQQCLTASQIETIHQITRPIEDPLRSLLML